MDQDGVFAALGHLRVEEIAALYKRMTATSKLNARRELNESDLQTVITQLEIRANPAEVSRAFRYVDLDAQGTLSFFEVVDVTQDCDDDAMSTTEWRLRHIQQGNAHPERAFRDREGRDAVMSLWRVLVGAGYSVAGEPLLRAALLHAKTRGAQGKGVEDYVKPKLVLALKEADRGRVGLTARGGTHTDRHGFLRWGLSRGLGPWAKRLTRGVTEEMCKATPQSCLHAACLLHAGKRERETHNALVTHPYERPLTHTSCSLSGLRL